MSILNSFLRSLFDAALAPFRGHPLTGLFVVSLLTAVAMLLIWKATSDQSAIVAVKRRIHACLFEIRLFNDDLRAILRAQLEILRHNLTYMRLSLVPMLWTLPPLILVIAQLQFHYGYRGLQPQEPALLKVRLANGQSGDGALSLEDLAKPTIELQAPSGIRIETPPLWIPSQREVDWRIAAERPGDFEISVGVDGKSYTKSVRATDQVVRRSPSRLKSSFLNQLLYPAEPPLPADGPLESIEVTYPDQDIQVFGWGLHWMVVYFVLSIALAFVLKKPLRVNL